MTLDIETREIDYCDFEGRVHKYLEPVCICLRVNNTSLSFALWDYNSVDEI